jgi:hypothetical protein
MLRIEPVLPMLRIEPALPMDKIEPALPMLRTLPKLKRLPTLPKLRMLNKLLALSRPARLPARAVASRRLERTDLRMVASYVLAASSLPTSLSQFNSIVHRLAPVVLAEGCRSQPMPSLAKP